MEDCTPHRSENRQIGIEVAVAIVTIVVVVVEEKKITVAYNRANQLFLRRTDIAIKTMPKEEKYIYIYIYIYIYMSDPCDKQVY